MTVRPYRPPRPPIAAISPPMAASSIACATAKATTPPPTPSSSPARSARARCSTGACRRCRGRRAVCRRSSGPRRCSASSPSPPPCWRSGTSTGPPAVRRHPSRWWRWLQPRGLRRARRRALCRHRRGRPHPPLSASSYGVRLPVLGFATALAALFVRELAAPYVLVCIFMARRERRPGELWAWLAGLAAFAAYFVWHYTMVQAQLTPADAAYPDGWVQFGGLRFVLSTAAFNGIVVALPLWVTAILLPLCLLGLAARRGSEPLRVAPRGRRLPRSFHLRGQAVRHLLGRPLHAPHDARPRLRAGGAARSDRRRLRDKSRRLTLPLREGQNRKAVLGRGLWPLRRGAHLADSTAPASPSPRRQAASARTASAGSGISPRPAGSS